MPAATQQQKLTKSDYLDLRNRYIPTGIRTIFVLESPPASGRYFYNPDGAVTEPLFRAMMKDVLGITPSSKEEGLKEFAARGHFLIDATYTPVNRCTDKEKAEIIARDSPALVEDLRNYAKPDTRIILVKANVCKLLTPRLIDADFNVLNHGVVIPFPSSGRQSEFRSAIQKVLAL